MLATVDALLPLSLLEAVRNVDTPSDQLDAEYVDELRNKRLGLSDTIYAQIKRHSEAVRRGQRTGQDEAIALAKLIGRRPDAEAVFRAAGRYMARQSYLTISPVTRKMMRLLPSAVGSSARVSSRAEDRGAVSQRQRAARRQLSAARRAALDHAGHGAGRDRLHVLRGVACASCCCCSIGSIGARRARALRGSRRGRRASGAPTGGRSTATPAWSESHFHRADAMLTPETLPDVQRALADAGVDGWLLYDFRGLNPIAARPDAARGHDVAPRLRVRPDARHAGRADARDRAGAVASLAAEVGEGDLLVVAKPRGVAREARRRQARRHGILGGRRRAVSRSHSGGRDRDGARRRVRRWCRRASWCRASTRRGTPTTSRRTSAPPEQIATIAQDALRLRRRTRANGDRPMSRARADGVDSAAVSADAELVTDHGPNVSAGANAANPHYEPSAERVARDSRRSEILLIDLWAHEEPMAACTPIRRGWRRSASRRRRR